MQHLNHIMSHMLDPGFTSRIKGVMPEGPSGHFIIILKPSYGAQPNLFDKVESCSIPVLNSSLGFQFDTASGATVFTSSAVDCREANASLICSFGFRRFVLTHHTQVYSVMN